LSSRKKFLFLFLTGHELQARSPVRIPYSGFALFVDKKEFTVDAKAPVPVVR